MRVGGCDNLLKRLRELVDGCIAAEGSTTTRRLQAAMEDLDDDDIDDLFDDFEETDAAAR